MYNLLEAKLLAVCAGEVEAAEVNAKHLGVFVEVLKDSLRLMELARVAYLR